MEITKTVPSNLDKTRPKTSGSGSRFQGGGGGITGKGQDRDDTGTRQGKDSALNKTFMEVDGIGQLSRFHCIINYGTQIVSLKKSQSAANIWNFP